MSLDLSGVKSEILRRSLRLARPGSFWKGKPDTLPLCPANILLFHRREASKLMAHSQHQHHRFILIANLGGAGKIAVDARMHSLRDHQSLLVFPFQSHCYVDLSPPAIHWVFISFEHSRDPRLDALRNCGGVYLKEDGLIHLRNLLRAWQSPSREDALPLHLGLWLHDMVRAVKNKPRPEPATPRFKDQNADLVAAVNRFVFDNRHRPLSIEELALHLGVSASSLRNRFRAATGRSVGRHAREIRLNYACELLSDTRLRIEEISERCGYESLFAFSRAFRNAHDSSPSQYRKTQVSIGSRQG